jgi:hypothetical protein
MRSHCCLSVCVCVSPALSLIDNGSVKIPLQLLCNGSEYTRNNRRIVGLVVCNVSRVVSRKVGHQFFPERLVIIFFFSVVSSFSSSSALSWFSTLCYRGLNPRWNVSAGHQWHLTVGAVLTATCALTGTHTPPEWDANYGNTSQAADCPQALGVRLHWPLRVFAVTDAMVDRSVLQSVRTIFHLYRMWLLENGFQLFQIWSCGSRVNIR